MVLKTPPELMEETKKDTPIALYYIKFTLTSIRYYVSSMCNQIIQHPLFETICLMVILTNCITLAIEDPLADDQPLWEINADYIFQAIYTAEILLKSFALGFCFNEGAYIRNPWNILDFIIVVFGYLSYFNVTNGLDLKSLRTFRVLRPLRTISAVEGLRLLIEALVSSLPLLLDILVILGFYFLILAIAGLQLWHGILKYRCFDDTTGIVNDSRCCGSHTCGNGDCVNFISNPNYGATSYDDVFSGLLTVFQCVTLESWSNVEQNISDAFGPVATIYFTLNTLVGAFFLMNFMLAVIKSRVSKTYEESRKLKKGESISFHLQSEDGQEQVVKMTLAKMLKKQKGKINQQLIDSRIEMVTKYLKKTEQPIEDPSITKANIARSMGFYNIEGILNYNDSEELLTKIHSKGSPMLREEVIQVTNEEYPNSSLNGSSLEEKIDQFDETNKQFYDILPVYKKSIEVSHTEKTKIMNTKNDIPIYFIGTNRKIAMSGILGLVKPSKPELSAVFCPQGNAFGNDDFTETFFSQLPPPLICTGINEQDMAKEKSSHRVANKISSSFLEFEDSHNQAGSMDVTPLNKEKDLNHPQNFGDLPFSSVSAKYKNIPIIKKENTKKEDEQDVKPDLNIMHENSLTDRAYKSNESPKTKEDTKKEIVVAKQISKDTTEDKKESETTQEIFEEKFILKIGEISAESLLDVQPKKIIQKEKIPEVTFKIVSAVAPYKLKMIYIPTEWPVEISIEEEEEKAYNQSFNTEAQKNQNIEQTKEIGNESSCGDTKNQKSTTRLRKVTKKPPKSKKDKKKIKKSTNDDSSSKTSNSQKKKTSNPTPSVDNPKKTDGQTSVSQDDKKKEKEQLEEDKQSIMPIIDKLKEMNEDRVVHSKKENPWSGQEVLQDSDPYAAIWLVDNLSRIRLWQYGYKGLLTKIRWLVKQFICSQYMENFMNLLVIVNTVTLAMDRYQQPISESAIMDKLNLVFTSIFTAELVLKLFGLGLIRYLSDSLNYLDFMVVIFSWIEIIFLGGSGAISAFRTLRVFRLIRTVRVLRVARLLRGLQSMVTLLDVIENTIGSFGYIVLMLLIFMLIYALFGIKLFAGKWNYPDGLPRPNFDSFNNAFISVFQLLTVENWPVLLYAGMRNQFQPLVALYYISFLLIGNYILLNMFLAIMLDSFVEVSAGQDDDEEEDEVLFSFYFLGRRRVSRRVKNSSIAWFKEIHWTFRYWYNDVR